MQKFKVTITTTEPMLGMSPNNEKIYSDYIASKSELPRKDELDAAARAEAAAKKAAEDGEKGMTIFLKDEDGTPFLWDYQLKGYFKDACGSLRRADGEETLSARIKAYKSVIDGCVFVYPRRVRLVIPEGGKPGMMERPLRAETPLGPRITLAKSETLPPGTKLTFEVVTLKAHFEETLREWLDYGALRGLCQWRNAGYGRFTYVMESVR